MVEIIIVRDNEGDDPPFAAPWDTVWGTAGDAFAGQGEWALADADEEPNNAGGLQARYELATAIFLALGTDKRRPNWQPRDVGGDPRGWHGDTFDIDRTAGERDMGSWLWLLERAPLTDETIRAADYYAREALQTLIDQGAIGEIDVTPQIDKAAGELAIFVQVFAVSGQSIFANAFPVVTQTN